MGGMQTDANFSSHVFIFATLMVVLAIRMTFASTVRGSSSPAPCR